MAFQNAAIIDAAIAKVGVDKALAYAVIEMELGVVSDGLSDGLTVVVSDGLWLGCRDGLRLGLGLDDGCQCCGPALIDRPQAAPVPTPTVTLTLAPDTLAALAAITTAAQSLADALNRFNRS